MNNDMPSLPRRWSLAPSPPEAAIRAISEGLRISPVAARLVGGRLANPSPEAARAFWQPHLRDLISPWRMPGMAEAARRLEQAIRFGQKIRIHADYDADGVTACSVMIRALRALGAEVDWHIPSRRVDGYGISDDFVRKAIEDRVDVVVTVDGGISEAERIEALARAGVDVIVTDHHEPGAILPEAAVAVLNPKLPGGGYPFRGLAGVGVAFKLAWALCETMAGAAKVGPRLQEVLLTTLPAVAVGTIADVAPLTSENRVLAAWGLEALSGQPACGWKALLEASRLAGKPITARMAAFSLAPRLNAAGRMGSADIALRLLLEDSHDAARALALELDQLNSARQDMCQRLMEEAEPPARRAMDESGGAAAVVGGDDWHEGVIGIVAGRLAERLGCPTAVVAYVPGVETGRGSVRTFGGVNLFKALENCRAHLLSFGGHEEAAGFNVARREKDAFGRAFAKACREQAGAGAAPAPTAVDMELPLPELRVSLVRELDGLHPCGTGNPLPRFLARGVRVAGQPRLLGGGQGPDRRFSFTASQGGMAIQAVVFKDAGWLEAIDSGALAWDIIYSPRLNDYWRPPRLEIGVDDMWPSETRHP